MSSTSMPSMDSNTGIASVVPIRPDVRIGGDRLNSARALWRRVRTWLAARIAPPGRGPDAAPPGLGDAGMSTVEYAIGTIAAAAFGAVLYAVLSSGTVHQWLTSLVQRAFTVSL